MLKLLIAIILLSTAFVSAMTKSQADVFSCTCGNGTPCTVTCQCTGSVSCGFNKCSSRCAACAGAGTKEVAMSLGSAVYETSYISSKGDYSADNLVTDFTEMLQGAKDLKFSDEDAQIGPDRRSYVVLRHTHGELRQSVLFPQDFLQATDEFLGNIKEFAPRIALGVKDRLKPFQKSLWGK